MKAGLTAMIFAIEALVKSGAWLGKGILFTAVIDEEVNFKGTQALIDSHELNKCVRAYISEPTSNGIATSLQGAAEFTAKVYGKSAHTGMAEKGVNAIVPMANFIGKLSELNNNLKSKGATLGYDVSPTINIGVIQGGTDILLVPDRCQMSFDRQVFPGEDMGESIREISELFKETCDKYNVQGELKCNQYFSSWSVNEDDPAVEVVRRSHKIANGQTPKENIFRAYTEIEMLDKVGIPGVLYGPGSILQAHRPNEYVELSQLEQATRTYALVAYDFVRR